jgi:hypothetical protein
VSLGESVQNVPITLEKLVDQLREASIGSRRFDLAPESADSVAI